MKLKLLLAIAIWPLVGADQPGYTFWSASELKGIGENLSVMINSKKIGTQQLVNYGNHYTMFAHREGSGEAEFHENDADILVIESGSATMVIGGEMVNGKATAPGEQRGPSIKGGTKQHVATGDVVHISPKVPHQMLLDPGARIDYFVIKIKQ